MKEQRLISFTLEKMFETHSYWQFRLVLTGSLILKAVQAVGWKQVASPLQLNVEYLSSPPHSFSHTDL